MPLNLEEILRIENRINQDDIGFSGIHHFVPKREIAFFMHFDKEKEPNYLDLKIRGLKVIANSKSIDRDVKDGLFVSFESFTGIQIVIDLNSKNNSVFKCLEEFVAFGKEFSSKFYGHDLKREFLGIPESNGVTNSHLAVSSSSYLAKRFLKTNGADFYGYSSYTGEFDVDLKTMISYSLRCSVRDYMRWREWGASDEAIRNYYKALFSFQDEIAFIPPGMYDEPLPEY